MHGTLFPPLLQPILLNHIRHMCLQLIHCVIRQCAVWQHLRYLQLGHPVLAVQGELFRCQVDAVQLVPLSQLGFGDHVAVGTRVPPAPVHSGRLGQGLTVDRLKLLEGEGDGTFVLAAKKRLSLVVLPALGNGLFGAAVIRRFSSAMSSRMAFIS